LENCKRRKKPWNLLILALNFQVWKN
jgi:hypothetical protein